MPDTRMGDALNRAKREALARVPPVRAVAARRHAARLARHRPLLPPLAPGAAALLGTLRRDGVAVTTLDALGLAGADVARSQLRSLVALLDGRPPGTPGPLRTAADELAAHAEAWRLGLAPPLLDLVEAYLGLPPRYHGAEIRRDLPDGGGAGVRQWHLDVEDTRMVKVLVWLADVDEGTGPFEYLPPDETAAVVRARRYVSGFVADDAVTAVLGAPAGRSCTGPAWTALIADTARVLHRARTPLVAPRDSVTYAWTSRHPLRTYRRRQPTQAQLDALGAGLDGRQLACVER